VPLRTLHDWRCHRFHKDHALCGVLGSPVLHSRGPAFHNPRFKAAFKDLLYLPLECGSAGEAVAALEALPILGASLTAPLKETVPPLLGLAPPLNTLYRRGPREAFRGANTDATALEAALAPLAPGPVLVLGGGGVAATTLEVLARAGRKALQASRKRPATPGEVAAFAPSGVIQATSLGMDPKDPAPFPDLLEAARPGLAWAVEWIYKEDTAFLRWAREGGLRVVDGGALFEAQARAQSDLFIRECGGA
jgi:shikimate 5-dehydrogenase